MSHSAEFRDARVVIAGAPGSGRAGLLHAVAGRYGGDPPERIDGGAWGMIRSTVPSQGWRIELCCLDGDCSYRGVQTLLAEGAAGVIFLFDVSPGRLMESRRVFEGLRSALQVSGQPVLLQYHRAELEPRFDAGRMDAWLGWRGPGAMRVVTPSPAPDGPGGSFDQLVKRLIEKRLG